MFWHASGWVLTRFSRASFRQVRGSRDNCLTRCQVWFCFERVLRFSGWFELWWAMLLTRQNGVKWASRKYTNQYRQCKKKSGEEKAPWKPLAGTKSMKKALKLISVYACLFWVVFTRRKELENSDAVKLLITKMNVGIMRLSVTIYENQWAWTCLYRLDFCHDNECGDDVARCGVYVCGCLRKICDKTLSWYHSPN